MIRLGIVSSIEEAGYAVVEAANADEAIGVMKRTAEVAGGRHGCRHARLDGWRPRWPITCARRWPGIRRAGDLRQGRRAPERVANRRALHEQALSGTGTLIRARSRDGSTAVTAIGEARRATQRQCPPLPAGGSAALPRAQVGSGGYRDRRQRRRWSFVIFAIFALPLRAGLPARRSKAPDAGHRPRPISSPRRPTWLVGRRLRRVAAPRFQAGIRAWRCSIGREAPSSTRRLPRCRAARSLALYDPSGAVLENGGSRRRCPPTSPQPTVLFRGDARASRRGGGAPQQVGRHDRHSPIDRGGAAARRPGSLPGVAVLAACPPSALERLVWPARWLTPGSTISLIREDGWIVAGRHPPLDRADEHERQFAVLTAGRAPEQTGTYDSGRSPGRRPHPDGRVPPHLPQYRVVAFGSVSAKRPLPGLWTSIIIVIGAADAPIAIALLGRFVADGATAAAERAGRSARSQRRLPTMKCCSARSITG